MGQEYSNPSRKDDKYSLPDLEVFRVTNKEPWLRWNEEGECSERLEPGFYWRSCFPGCMPEGDAVGPFPTYEEALASAREGCGE